MVFNPFDKSSNEPLALNDLKQLIDKQVTEGLYIEYKFDFRPNSKIAHSLASFANSYGGWYFIGIEADKILNVATKIVGIDLNLHKDPIAQVRDVSKSYISPTPAVRLQLVKVGDDKAVLVAFIPDGQDKPFVTSDGRIYRRNADSSDPISERDRYAIDRLYDEGRQYRKTFGEFCRHDLILDQEEHSGWLGIYVAPYPDLVENFDRIEEESVKHFLERSKMKRDIPFYDKSYPGTMPFDVAFATYQSVIFRQVMSNPVTAHPLAVEFFTDGWAKFLIPIPFFHNFQWRSIHSLRSEEAKEALYQIEGMRESVEKLRFIDIGNLAACISSLVSFYFEWLGEQPSVQEFRFAVSVDDVRRAVPFCDSDLWGRFARQHGLPVNSRKTIHLPEPERWFTWRKDDPFALWQMISVFVTSAFGLPEKLHNQLLADSADRSLMSHTKRIDPEDLEAQE